MFWNYKRKAKETEALGGVGSLEQRLNSLFYEVSELKHLNRELSKSNRELRAENRGIDILHRISPYSQDAVWTLLQYAYRELGLANDKFPAHKESE